MKATILRRLLVVGLLYLCQSAVCFAETPASEKIRQLLNDDRLRPDETDLRNELVQRAISHLAERREYDQALLFANMLPDDSTLINAVDPIVISLLATGDQKRGYELLKSWRSRSMIVADDGLVKRFATIHAKVKLKQNRSDEALEILRVAKCDVPPEYLSAAGHVPGAIERFKALWGTDANACYAAALYSKHLAASHQIDATLALARSISPDYRDQALSMMIFELTKDNRFSDCQYLVPHIREDRQRQLLAKWVERCQKESFKAKRDVRELDVELAEATTLVNVYKRIDVYLHVAEVLIARDHSSLATKSLDRAAALISDLKFDGKANGPISVRHRVAPRIVRLVRLQAQCGHLSGIDSMLSIVERERIPLPKAKLVAEAVIFAQHKDDDASWADFVERHGDTPLVKAYGKFGQWMHDSELMITLLSDEDFYESDIGWWWARTRSTITAEIASSNEQNDRRLLQVVEDSGFLMEPNVLESLAANHRDPMVRVRAVEALEIFDPRLIPSGLLADNDIRVRIAAARSFLTFPEHDDAVIAVLQDALEEDRVTLQIDALRCLSELGSRASSAPDKVVAMTRSTHERVRLYACQALFRIGVEHELAVKVARDLVHSDDPWIVARAIKYLGEYALRDPGIAAMLRELGNGQDLYIRMHVAEAFN